MTEQRTWAEIGEAVGRNAGRALRAELEALVDGETIDLRSPSSEPARPTLDLLHAERSGPG